MRRFTACFLVLTAALQARELELDHRDENFDQMRPALPAIARLSWDIYGETDFERDGGSVKWNTLEASSPIYFRRFGDATSLAISLNFTMADVEVDKPEFQFDEKLYGMFLPISASHKSQAAQWAWFGQVAPGLRTDFNGIDGDDFAFRAFGGAFRSFGPNFLLGIGAFVSYDYDSTFAAPGVGFVWMPRDDWAISLIPPRLAATWLPNEEWMVSIEARPRSQLASALRSRSGRNLASLSGDDGPDEMKLSYGEAGVAVKRRLLADPGIWLALRGGLTFGGELDARLDGRSLFDDELEPGWFGGGSIELLSW